MCVSFIIFNFSIQKLCRRQRGFFAQPRPPQAIFINIQIYFDLHLILPLLTLQPTVPKCLRAKAAVKLSWNCGCRTDFHSIQFDYCMLICLIQLQLLLLLLLLLSWASESLFVAAKVKFFFSISFSYSFCLDVQQKVN